MSPTATNLLRYYTFLSVYTAANISEGFVTSIFRVDGENRFFSEMFVNIYQNTWCHMPENSLFSLTFFSVINFVCNLYRLTYAAHEEPLALLLQV